MKVTQEGSMKLFHELSNRITKVPLVPVKERLSDHYRKRGKNQVAIGRLDFMRVGGAGIEACIGSKSKQAQLQNWRFARFEAEIQTTSVPASPSTPASMAPMEVMMARF